MVNAGWLLVLCLLVAASAVHRMVTGAREVHGLPVLVVSGIAAVVMLGGALLLGAIWTTTGGSRSTTWAPRPSHTWTQTRTRP